MMVGRTVLQLGLGLMILVGLASPAESASPKPTYPAAEVLDEDSEILAVVNGESLYSLAWGRGLSFPCMPARWNELEMTSICDIS